MSINEKDVKDYEEKYKKLLYSKIEKVISGQAESVTLMTKTGRHYNINEEIPNVGITLNNKLNEISQRFQKAGISMFVEPVDKHDFVTTNFVGDAIIEDMIYQTSNAVEELEKYNSGLHELADQEKNKIMSLEKSGPIKKLFLKIRSFFAPSTMSNLLSVSQDEIQKVSSHLSQYKEIDEKIWNYNLKDNVVQSLVNYINNMHYGESAIPEILNENVMPTLQKLGLEDLMPQIEEKLQKSKELSNHSNNKSWELSSLQKIGIQISTQGLADRVETNKNDTKNIEESERSE